MTKKAKQVEHWGQIDPAVFDEFEKRVYALQKEMIPCDFDGSSPVSVVLVNRVKHEYFHYMPVPRNDVYSAEIHGAVEFHPDKQEEMDIETERGLKYNLRIATDELQRYLDRRSIDFEQRKSRRENAKKSLKVRIKEGCAHCRLGVAFELNPEVGSPIPVFHIGKLPCTSRGLRYMQWKKERGKEIPSKPEPRWCLKCQARLSDYNSRRGVEDKDICMNDFCPSKKRKSPPLWPNVAEKTK